MTKIKDFIEGYHAGFETALQLCIEELNNAQNKDDATNKIIGHNLTIQKDKIEHTKNIRKLKCPEEGSRGHLNRQT